MGQFARGEGVREIGSRGGNEGIVQRSGLKTILVMLEGMGKGREGRALHGGREEEVSRNLSADPCNRGWGISRTHKHGMGVVHSGESGKRRPVPWGRNSSDKRHKKKGRQGIEGKGRLKK